MPCPNFGGVLHSICWTNTIGSALKILILEDKGLQIPWDGNKYDASMIEAIDYARNKGLIKTDAQAKK